MKVGKKFREENSYSNMNVKCKRHMSHVNIINIYSGFPSFFGFKTNNLSSFYAKLNFIKKD